MYPEACCDKLAGRAEHLDKTPTHPIQMEGVVYTMAPTGTFDPREFLMFSQLPSLLYMAFFSYGVQNMILCKSNHFVGCMCR